jgi:hypothetical protein
MVEIEIVLEPLNVEEFCLVLERFCLEECPEENKPAVQFVAPGARHNKSLTIAFREWAEARAFQRLWWSHLDAKVDWNMGQRSY